MLTYDTYTERQSLPGKQAARPLAAYGINHADVLRSLSGANYDIAAAKADAEYANQYQQSQQTSALSGLRQMSEEQEQGRSLYNTRLQNMMGVYGGLLQGLFS
jgi:multidrug efflux pump subunit AcrB